jgi:predicted AAA+ superfamily ATPase
LGRKTLSAKTPEFGTLLEQSIFCEIKAFLDYHAIYDSLFYWRSTSLIEVDFVVKDTKGEWLGIEVKAAEAPQRKDFSGLLALEEDLPLKNKIVVCQTKTPRINKDNIEILPVRKFLEGLWARKWI